MAALGAAAGAFEGDNARAEQRARMAQLSLQGAQLAQGDRQFDEQTKLARERMASAEEENALQRRDNLDAMALRQKNTDRQFALDEKQFQAGRENDLYQRGRNERQDAWGEALNAQEMMEKQERIKTNRLQFEELDRAAKMEREKLANRQRLAKTGLGALALSALRNGGIAAPSAIELFNKQQEQAGTGIKVSGGVWSKDGFAFKREGPAVDQNGQPIQGKMAEYPELMNPAIARAIFKEEFGEDIAEEQSSAQRESTKYEHAKDIASLRGKRATRFDAKQLEAIDTDIYEYENGLQVKGLAPEEKAHLEGQLKAAKEFRRSLIYGGEPSEQAAAAPSGNGASSQQSSVPQDVFAEQQKAMKLAMQKPENERRAYYDRHMSQYMASRGNGAQSDKPAQSQAQAQTPQPEEQSQAARDAEAVTQEQAAPSSYGPSKDDPAYWRDMPTGADRTAKKADGSGVKEARKEILRRLETAYRMPKGPEKQAAIAKIKAELDAFNRVHPV